MILAIAVGQNRRGRNRGFVGQEHDILHASTGSYVPDNASWGGTNLYSERLKDGE